LVVQTRGRPQAMACGLPLVCTTNSGGADLLEEGQEGFTVPIRDPEALKDKLLLLYRDRVTCREMGRAARRKIEDNFSWSRYGDRVYENCLKIYRDNA